MATFRLDFVSQDRMIFTGDVAQIQAPGIEGQLGILPRHAPLMTILTPGEIVIKRAGQDDLFFAVSGGWMEVHPDKVTILARSAEHSDEIDLQRAEAARERAQALLAQGAAREERTLLELALTRSQIRLKVAKSRRTWKSTDSAPHFDEKG
jgi:F-type H+-transporting ATPase subunit epsilon